MLRVVVISSCCSRTLQSAAARRRAAFGWAGAQAGLYSHPRRHDIVQPAANPPAAAAGQGMAAAATNIGEAAAAPAGGSTPEDPLLQYVVLRRDLWTELDWPLGSVVAQGCHAATAALWESREAAATREYCAPENIDHMHKVVLEIKSEAQLRNLAAKLAEAGVPHKLWVEQPEDIATCLATVPSHKSAVAPHVKKLKLCKGS